MSDAFGLHRLVVASDTALMRATTSGGTSAPDNSAMRLMLLRLVIGMIPGRTGLSTPRSREVVHHPA